MNCSGTGEDYVIIEFASDGLMMKEESRAAKKVVA
jgi:hypothetical protein